MADYDFAKIEKKLSKYLDEDRFQHTMGVMYTSACLAMVHGYDIKDAQVSGLLHDCGKFISLRDSSACAYNIIMATEIIGLSHAEREIVAEVVRCNLDAFRYGEGSIRAGKLTAMLRLANAMDRSHHGRLDDGKLQVKGNKLIISTSYAGNLALETMAVEDKADFFEEMFGIRPEIRQKRRV